MCSWILVGFVSAAPQWEPPYILFKASTVFRDLDNKEHVLYIYPIFTISGVFYSSNLLPKEYVQATGLPSLKYTGFLAEPAVSVVNLTALLAEPPTLVLPA